MRWRRFDQGWLAAAWDDLRPRFVRLTVRARGINLRWWVPLGALESLALVLKLAPLLLTLLPPNKAARFRRYWPTAAPDTLTLLASLFDDTPLLRLPVGEPLLAISTPDFDFELREV
jgi:hypothetical protein